MKAIHPDTKEDVPGDMHRGIYVAGNTGSGKSWCLEVMLAYADLFRFKIKYGGDDARIWWRIARADEIVARFVETTSIDEYKKAKLLCIQDFGAEQLEAVAMGNRMNVLRTLLEYRGDRSDCLTMITSNYSLKNPTLTESYGERVTSRLMEMCNYFEIKGKDRRKL
jgi:DNA replication protein DnaC